MEITRTFIAIFGFKLYWYGILIALGAFLAFLLADRRARAMGLPKDTAIDTALVALPAGVVGARAYFVLMHRESYPDLSSILALRDGGLGIYGGIITGLICLWLYARRKKLKMRDLTDMAAPCVALAQAIGRWGNFLNEEAHGMEITNPCLRFFPVSVQIDGTYYAAAFFYESVWCLMIFLVIYFGRRRAPGRDTLLYLTLYALERGIVESLRTDSLTIGPVRASQLLSVLVLIAVFCILTAKRPARFPMTAAFGLCAAFSLAGALTLLPQTFVYVFLPLTALPDLALIRKEP